MATANTTAMTPPTGMLAVPKKEKGMDFYAEDLDKNVNFIADTFVKATKINLKNWRERKKEHEALTKSANLDIKASDPASVKIKKRLMKVYEKYIVKGKFFQNALAAFKKFGEKASNWFFDLLKLLLFFAIFDPKGVFLRSILNFLVKMVVWLIRILAKMLPQIIKTIIYLVTEVIPPALKEAVTAIFDALVDMFNAFIKELPEGSVFKTILTFIKDAFGKDGILRKFFMFLAGAFPFIFAGLGVLMLVTKMLPLLMAIKSIALFLIANPVVALIVGIAVAFALMYAYADELLDLFDKINNWFDDFSKNYPILGTILKAMWATIDLLLVTPVKMVLKLFSGIKSGKLIESFKNAWDAFEDIGIAIDDFERKARKFIKSLPKLFKDGILKAFNLVFAGFKTIGEGLGGLWNRIWNALPQPLKDLLKSAGGMIDKAKDAGGKALTYVADLLVKNFWKIVDKVQGFIAWLSDLIYDIDPRTARIAGETKVNLGMMRDKGGLYARKYAEGAVLSETERGEAVKAFGGGKTGEQALEAMKASVLAQEAQGKKFQEAFDIFLHKKGNENLSKNITIGLKEYERKLRKTGE